MYQQHFWNISSTCKKHFWNKYTSIHDWQKIIQHPHQNIYISSSNNAFNNSIKMVVTDVLSVLFLENHTLVMHGRHQTAGRSFAAQFHLIWQSKLEANQKIKHVPSVSSVDPSPVITVIHIFNLQSYVFLLSIGILGFVGIWRGDHLKLSIPSQWARDCNSIAWFYNDII